MCLNTEANGTAALLASVKPCRNLTSSCKPEGRLWQSIRQRAAQYHYLKQQVIPHAYIAHIIAAVSLNVNVVMPSKPFSETGLEIHLHVLYF